MLLLKQEPCASKTHLHVKNISLISLSTLHLGLYHLPKNMHHGTALEYALQQQYKDRGSMFTLDAVLQLLENLLLFVTLTYTSCDPLVHSLVCSKQAIWSVLSSFGPFHHTSLGTISFTFSISMKTVCLSSWSVVSQIKYKYVLPGLYCPIFIFFSQPSFEDHNINLLIIVGCNNVVLYPDLLFCSYLSHFDFNGFQFKSHWGS